MRWDALFADMESQLDAAIARTRDAEVAELTRAERAAVGLADRLRAGLGAELRVTLRSAEAVRGVLSDVGLTWLLVGGVREHLVPLAAVTGVAGLGEAVAPAPDVVFRRLGIGHALRAIARDRSVVRVATGPTNLIGRIEGVGADHFDLAVTDVASARPAGERVTVPFAALDLVSGP